MKSSRRPADLSPKEGARYNPDGLVSDKPIALRLMPDELKEAERISEQANKSKSALARAAYLKGLPLVIKEFLEPTSTGPSGGEASASPAAFSSPAALGQGG